MRLLSNLQVKGKPAVLPDRAIRSQSHYFIYRPCILGHACLVHIIFGNVISTKTKTNWYVLKKWTIGTINLEQTIAAKINSIEMMYRPINILLTLTDQSVKLWNFPRSIKGAQLLCMDYWVSTRLYITAERAARGLSEDWNLVTLCIQKSS